ncbi:hypothetical protein [Leptolyngbya sp. FACHB-261]|uniref:hypothetical protein n=1 Tax=Leptolyngbya sp. FACHB-261 TaxID=2692806 RepID=UPI001682219E|nr:hypothetical protein [Leptolyngbya sp. FACHB-261]MBD2103002.1 hypothetical protein [Leptolyngbya sp. FACHB-261]
MIVAKAEGLFKDGEPVERLNLRSKYGESNAYLSYEQASKAVQADGLAMTQDLYNALHLAREATERALSSNSEERIDEILEQGGWVVLQS